MKITQILPLVVAMGFVSASSAIEQKTNRDIPRFVTYLEYPAINGKCFFQNKLDRHYLEAKHALRQDDSFLAAFNIFQDKIASAVETVNIFYRDECQLLAVTVKSEDVKELKAIFEKKSKSLLKN